MGRRGIEKREKREKREREEKILPTRESRGSVEAEEVATRAHDGYWCEGCRDHTFHEVAEGVQGIHPRLKEEKKRSEQRVRKAGRERSKRRGLPPRTWASGLVG